MRIIIYIFLFILSGNISAQYEYFNNLYPADGTIEGGNGLFTHVLSQDSLYYVAGLNFENDMMNFFVEKLTENGEIESYTEFYSSNGLAVSFGNGFSQHQDNEGFYHLGEGYNQENQVAGFIFSLNQDLTIDWSFELMSNSPDTISHQLLTVIPFNENVLITGSRIYDFTIEAGDSFSSLVLFYFNNSGEMIWESEISYSDMGGPVNSFITVLQSLSLSDDIILVTGNIPWQFFSKKILIKINNDGTLNDWHEWGDGVYNEWVPFALPKSDSTVMVTYQKGYGLLVPESYNTVYGKLHLMEFNYETMEPVWDVEFEPQFDVNYLYDFLQADDGGYYICGSSSSNQSGIPIEGIPDESNGVAYILKTDSIGEFEWLKYYYFTNDIPFENGELQKLYSFDNAPDGGIIGVGYQISGGNQNPWAIKVDACGDVEDLGCPGVPNVSVADYEDVQSSILAIYPNPSNSQVTLEYTKARIQLGYQYKIFNQQGQLINTGNFDGFQTLDISSWSAGLYLVQIIDRKGLIVQESKLFVN